MADSVTLNARIGPVALYEASPIRGTVPLTVNFTNLSLGEVSTYLWDFGDGATSALANPTHVYANPGVYTATLTVSNPYSTDTYTAPQIVVGTQPIIHSLPFTDDMESPHENWQVTNMWLPAALATTSTHEPGTVWKGMNGESALILVDRLDLSTASVPVLSFWHKFVTNTGMGQVVVTTDNGLTWSPVYTITAPITTWTQTVADTNCCGQKSLWTKTVVDLSDYSGEQIGLAFISDK
ncbi:MAG: PKD domain-containing protein [Chloroflexi bacterium]|nr:PKD domain-containing protein [Chloroflexota bacterium]